MPSDPKSLDVTIMGRTAYLSFGELSEQALKTALGAAELVVKMLVIVLLGCELLTQAVVLLTQAMAKPKELGNLLFEACQLVIHSHTISLKSL